MSDDKEKTKKSLTRSKKSGISLADAIGKEALASLVPGGRFVYEVGKILVKHGISFYNDRKKTRIENFHKSLLENTPEKDLRMFLEKPFSIEDYYTLLSNSVMDDENAKVAIYSKLLKAIITETIPLKYKIHFIKSVKELTFYDIELMRKLYVRNKYVFMGEKNISIQVPVSVETKDPIENFSFQTLIRLGFLVQKDVQNPIWNKINNRMFESTELLMVFVSNVFTQEELTPKSIGEETLKVERYFYIAISDLSKHQSALNVIVNSLNKLQMNYVIDVPKPIQEGELYLSMVCDNIILCLDKEKDAEESPIVPFARHKIIKEKKLLKILLSKSQEDKLYDPLPDVSALAIFDFTSKDNYAVKEFEEFIRTKIEN